MITKTYSLKQGRYTFGSLIVSWLVPSISTTIAPGDNVSVSFEYRPTAKTYGMYYDLGVLDDNGDFVSIGDNSDNSPPKFFSVIAESGARFTTTLNFTVNTLTLTQRINDVRLVFYGKLTSSAVPTIADDGVVSGDQILHLDYSTAEEAPTTDMTFLTYRLNPTFDCVLNGTTIGRTGASFSGGYVQNKTDFSFGISNIVADDAIASMQAVIGSGSDAQTFDLSVTGTPTTLPIGTLDMYGASIPYSVIITDVNNMTSTPRTGTITLLQYSPPEISAYSVVRYLQNADLSYTESVVGENFWIDINTYVSPLNNANAWTLVANYEDDTGNTSGTVAVGSGSDGGAFSIEETQRDPLTATTVFVSGGTPIVFSINNAWAITAVLSDFFTSTTLITEVNKGLVRFDVQKYGVGVGMKTTGTVNDKRFEVADDYTSHFYGDVVAHGSLTDANGNPIGIANYVAAETYMGKWNGEDFYRQEFTKSDTSTGYVTMGTVDGMDKILQITGTVKITSSGNIIYRPISSYTGSTVAYPRVNTYTGVIQAMCDVSGNKEFTMQVYYTKVVTP